MEREKFVQEARLTAHRILEGKENGIMNLVQRAWAEGKRNAEVETLRAPIDEALDRREPKEPPKDAVYPTWMEWLTDVGAIPKAISWDEPLVEAVYDAIQKHIPADMAEKLGIEPKEDA